MNNECRSQVESHLQGGESLIAACECQLAPGVPDLPHWPRRPPPESDAWRQVRARLPGPVRKFLEPSPPKVDGRLARTMEGADQAADNALSRAAHGKGLHGGWESQAGQFLMTHYTAAYVPAARLLVAFTDRRMLVLGDRSKLWQSKGVFHPQWEAPRAAIAGVRTDPKGILQRGRFELRFADGSWIALVAWPSTHAGPFVERVGR